MYKQKMIVVGTMGPSQFIREHEGEDEDFARFDRDPNFIQYRKDITNMQFHRRHRMGQLSKQTRQLWINFMTSWPPHSLLLGTSS
jgi:hypothetical protein